MWRVLVPDKYLLMQGTLPASLADLGKLTQFVVNGNALSGSIPPFIGSYPGVREAWLARNRFSGPLNASLCQSNGTGDSIYLQVSSRSHPSRTLCFQEGGLSKREGRLCGVC